MTFPELVKFLNDIAWGPWMLVLLVGTGVYLSARVGFIQFTKFGYAMKNTLGKLFKKQTAGGGEVTPFQALTTALAATVGTGNIAGVTGAIAVGGPGAVFWMWISALFGMVTKYSEVVLAVKYRERNAKGDYVGGPMYYIRNGMGKQWNWLAVLFSLLACLAAFGIGNMTQVNTIATTFNTTIDAFGGNTGAVTITMFGQVVPVSSIAIGMFVALIVALVLFGGIKRIGSVTEKLVPVMAAVYIVCSLIIIGVNFEAVGGIFAMIFKGAFSADAALGGAFGITIMTTIQKGVGRGVFSNEAGLGSAPMAHAATSEKDPVKQGLYGIFEVFMDTIVICTLTALTLLCGLHSGVDITWGQSAGTELIIASFATVFGQKAGSLIVAVGIGLFALSTILSWSLYGTRCCEFLLGHKSVPVYQTIFVAVIIIGATLELDLVWNIADTLNGFMAIPNLVALLGLSGVVYKLTKEHFEKEKLGV
ncbi:MAG: sodium:alanine symporter family protein [Oscillospiraceae bacterium]|nr:sodium:alanine symporter family protein [Oscillospiraceae bacterium]MBQ7130407.1 sodium:alanine symporter family protein [Oscillospiraceae bacterium]